MSSGLGKGEPDLEEKKPAVEKVKVEKYSDLKKCFVGIHIFIVSVFPQAKQVGGILTLFKKEYLLAKQVVFCLGNSSRV